MKNVHVLLTVKPSRLAYYQESTSYNKPVLQLVSATSSDYKYQNIYITNDEEIKEGDWFIRDGSIHKCFRVHKTDIEFLTSIDSVYCGSNTFWSKGFCKKIILTTDQDLDSVQAIDDEFLEWFIKNPSCEEVKVKHIIKEYVDDLDAFGYDANNYKIITPKEEPKQELKVGDNTNFGIITDIKEKSVCFGKSKVGVDVWYKKSDVKLVPKQETTLEEFIESQPYYGTCTYEYKEGIGVGAKWQKEQILDFLYSEITERRDYSASKMCEKVIEFIEQYKNK